jgi:RNA-directed DNA polymerase
VAALERAFRRQKRQASAGVDGVTVAAYEQALESRRLTRKPTAFREEAWRLMHAPLTEQHRWYASVLRGHYGYYGMPHNYRALSGFRQAVRRIWFSGLRRRRQKSRSMGWDMFEALTERFPLPPPRITHPWSARTA